MSMISQIVAKQPIRLVTRLDVVLLERLANLDRVVRVHDSGGARRIVDDEVHPVIRPGLVWQDLQRYRQHRLVTPICGFLLTSKSSSTAP